MLLSDFSEAHTDIYTFTRVSSVWPTTMAVCMAYVHWHSHSRTAIFSMTVDGWGLGLLWWTDDPRSHNDSSVVCVQLSVWTPLTLDRCNARLPSVWIFFISFNRWHHHHFTYCQYFTPFLALWRKILNYYSWLPSVWTEIKHWISLFSVWMNTDSEDGATLLPKVLVQTN